MVAGAPDPLHAARNRRRRFDLHHQIDRSHIDAEFQTKKWRRCRAASRSSGAPRYLCAAPRRRCRDAREPGLRRPVRSLRRRCAPPAAGCSRKSAWIDARAPVPAAWDEWRSRWTGARGLAKPARWGSARSSSSRLMSSSGTSTHRSSFLGAPASTMVTGRKRCATALHSESRRSAGDASAVGGAAGGLAGFRAAQKIARLLRAAAALRKDRCAARGRPHRCSRRSSESARCAPALVGHEGVDFVEDHRFHRAQVSRTLEVSIR